LTEALKACILKKSTQPSLIMRVIEQKMVSAIQNEKNWSWGNTAVTIENGRILVRLYGHLIAIICEHKIVLSSCGYTTKTTKSRLNAILDHLKLPTIYQKDLVWYIGNKEFEDFMEIAY
jgi:hypothetical protein